MIYFLTIGPLQIIIVGFMVFIAMLSIIIALIDVVRNEFTENNKIVWLLVILLSNFIGAILYFIFGRKQKTSKKNKTI